MTGYERKTGFCDMKIDHKTRGTLSLFFFFFSTEKEGPFRKEKEGTKREHCSR
jgi:hypothetical protein